MFIRYSIVAASLLFVLLPLRVYASPCDAYFTFDGTLADSSGNERDGVLIPAGGNTVPDGLGGIAFEGPGVPAAKAAVIGPLGGPMPYDTGRNGQALKLDGTSAVRVPLDLNVNACPQLTITAWVKFDDNPVKGRQFILSSGVGGPALVREGVNLNVVGGGQRYRASKALRAGTWEFIAATIDYEGGVMKVYWRNRESEQKISSKGTRSAEIWIGAVGDDVREPVMAGLIDDLHIIGGVLTPDQIVRIRDNVGQAGARPKIFGDD